MGGYGACDNLWLLVEVDLVAILDPTIHECQTERLAQNVGIVELRQRGWRVRVGKEDEGQLPVGFSQEQCGFGWSITEHPMKPRSLAHLREPAITIGMPVPWCGQ